MNYRDKQTTLDFFSLTDENSLCHSHVKSSSKRKTNIYEIKSFILLRYASSEVKTFTHRNLFISLIRLSSKNQNSNVSHGALILVLTSRETSIAMDATPRRKSFSIFQAYFTSVSFVPSGPLFLRYTSQACASARHGDFSLYLSIFDRFVSARATRCINRIPEMRMRYGGNSFCVIWSMYAGDR